MNINDYFGIIGSSSLVIALGLCTLTIVLTVIAIFHRKKAISGSFLLSVTGQAFTMGIAVFSLGWLLMNDAFEYSVVFNTVERGMPWYYKLSGLWSGQAGSLLFWSFNLSVFLAIFAHIASRRMPGAYAVLVSLILTVILVFFLVPVVIVSNPFQRLFQLADGSMIESVFAPIGSGLIVPVDGQGMNPSLRHPAMLSHPPTLYVGLVGFFIPFTFALSALAFGDKEHVWIKKAYPVVVFAWIFLTAGMFLGSWWAYTILGWGGYWGWDAVEIAGLLPWLLSFGLIHSMQMQMRGKNFLRWIYVFSGAIVFFILSGVLITRSGILDSVHAYAVGVMGPVLSVLILLCTIPYVYFFFKRRIHKAGGDDLDSSSISEKLARLLNISLVLLALIYFVGQSFPLTSQLFTGQRLNWTQDMYERLSSPLLLAVLILTALFPLSDEKTGKVVGDLRLAMLLIGISLIFPIYLLFNTNISLVGAFGFGVAGFLMLAWVRKLFKLILEKKALGYRIFSVGMALLHLGLGFMSWGILGSENLSRQYDVSVDIGTQTEIDGLILIGKGRDFTLTELGTEIYLFDIVVSEPGKQPAVLTPDMEYYPKLNTLYPRPAIDSDLTGDVQLIINEWESSFGSGAGVRVNIQPLIAWIWIGGIFLCLGGVILFFSGRFAYPALHR